jgi:alpha-glucosidase
VTGEKAWTWNAERNQCYLHQLGKGRPDFNFYNPAVQQELLNDTLQFWIDHGVAGFRMGAVHYLYEDDKYEDEPGNDSGYESLNHTYTVNHPKNLEALNKIRSLLDSNEFSDGKRRYASVSLLVNEMTYINIHLSLLGFF